MNLQDQPQIVLLKICEYLDPLTVWRMPCVCKALHRIFFAKEHADFLSCLVGQMTQQHYGISWREAILLMKSMNLTRLSFLPLESFNVGHLAGKNAGRHALPPGRECGGRYHDNTDDFKYWSKYVGGFGKRLDRIASCNDDESPLNVWQFYSACAGNWIGFTHHEYEFEPFFAYLRMPCGHAASRRESSDAMLPMHSLCAEASLWHQAKHVDGIISSRSRLQVYGDSKVLPTFFECTETPHLMDEWPATYSLTLVHSNVLLGLVVGYEQGDTKKYALDFIGSCAFVRRDLYVDRIGAATLAKQIRRVGNVMCGSSVTMASDTLQRVRSAELSTSMLRPGRSGLCVRNIGLEITATFDEVRRDFVQNYGSIASLLKPTDDIKALVCSFFDHGETWDELLRCMSIPSQVREMGATDSHSRSPSIALMSGVFSSDEQNLATLHIAIVDEHFCFMKQPGGMFLWGTFCGSRLLLSCGEDWGWIEEEGARECMSGVLINKGMKYG